jgi:tetratricopeptide (TPR) repeat protein
MKAYLSSTLDDLRDEREAVRRALEGLWTVKESYEAHEAGVIESCLRDVANCDIYILIVGMRYGSVPPGYASSITELEYEGATNAGIPRFVFLKRFHENPIEEAGHDRTRVEAFRQRLSLALSEGSRPAIFESAQDLQVKLLRALDGWKERRAYPLPDAEAWEAAARPVPPRPLCLGRDALLASLVRRLVSGPSHSGLLLGRPGIGKTTLALAILHDATVAGHYGPRRYLTRCDGFRSRPGLIEAIAASIGLQPGTSQEGAVRRQLADRPALLVLDGIDSAWKADTVEVEELLAGLVATPGLALLATKSGAERMGPAVEWGAVEHVVELDVESAKAMFQRLAPHIAITDRRLRPLVQVLGRVPLAIALMAHQAHGESDLRALSRRWRSEKLAMLKRAGGREPLTNLQLSCELALRDLDAGGHAARLLARAALLRAGIALEDVDAVMPDGAGAALPDLRRAGLVVADMNRLQVPSPLREYVNETRVDRTDRPALVRHYVGLARLLEARLGTGDADAVRARLAAEAGGIEWAIGRGLRESDPEAIDAAISWCRVTRHLEGASWGLATQAATLAAAAGLHPKEGECLLALGYAHLAKTTPDRASECFERAKVVFDTLADTHGVARCVLGIAEAALSGSSLAAARKAFEEARQTFEEWQDTRGQADCAVGLASVEWLTAPRAVARARFAAALDLYRACGSLVGQADALRNMADLDLEQSAYDAAAEGFSAANAIYATVGDLLRRAHCALGLAEIARARCPDGEALRLFEQIRQMYRRLGRVRGEADCLYRIASIVQVMGDRAAAERAYVESGVLYDECRWKLGRANVTLALSSLALARGDDAAAAEGFAKARATYEALPERAGQGYCRLGLAQLAVKRHDAVDAQAEYAAALVHFDSVGDPYAMGLARLSWADSGVDPNPTIHLADARRAWSKIPQPYIFGIAAGDGVPRARVETLMAAAPADRQG